MSENKDIEKIENSNSTKFSKEEIVAFEFAIELYEKGCTLSEQELERFRAWFNSFKQPGQK